VFVARQVARARRHLGVARSQQAQQRSEAVARFRRTGRKAAVDGRLSSADRLVGVAQLLFGERVYRDDTATVIDVLSHMRAMHTSNTYIAPGAAEASEKRGGTEGERRRRENRDAEGAEWGGV